MGTHQSARNATDVWLTPPHLLARLGAPAAFDLDPCAAPEPRPWPTAKEHWTERGLDRAWHGCVYCNPPYGGPSVIGPWMRRMAEHACGVALIFARTETEVFFDSVWGKASAVLFLKGRLFFHRADGTRAAHNGGAPSCLVAYGTRCATALHGMQDLGFLVEMT